MTNEELKELLLSFFEKACSDPHSEATRACLGEAPTSSLKSAQEYLSFFNQLHQAIDSPFIELEDFMACGELLRYAGTLRGRSKKTAQDITWRVAGVVEIEGQRIVAGTHYADFLSLFRQLKAVPTDKPSSPSKQTLETSSSAASPTLELLLELCDASYLGALISSGENDEILQTNNSFKRLLGASTLDKVDFHSLLADEDRTREQELFGELVEGKRSSYSERLCFQREGTGIFIWLTVSATTYRKDGQLLVLRTLSEATLGREAVEFLEEENHRVSREIHDTIAQDAAALWILMQSGAFDYTAQKLLERIKDEVLTLRANVRAPNLTVGDLTQALEDLKVTFLIEFGIEFDLEIKDLPELPEKVRLAIFRVVQEALRNVANHAGECRATVRLEGRPGKVLGRVEDQGEGFELGSSGKKTERFGIVGMRERCKALGGKLDVQSKVGLGTILSFEIPLH